MRFWIYSTVALLALFAAYRTLAEDHRPFSEMQGDCGNYTIDLKSEFTAWEASKQRLEDAGTSISRADAPDLLFGQKLTLGLAAMKSIAVAIPPSADKQKMYSGKFGGFAKFRAPKSGNYRLSAGSKAWIELLDNKLKPVPAYAFEMQTKCEKIFKAVNFHFKRGKTYFVQITGSQVQNLSLLMTRAR